MNLLPIDFNKFSKEYSDKLVLIEEYFKNRLGVEMYLVYGTLLGAIKCKTFLKHDNDIDISYLSKYSNRQDVQKELLEFHQKLREDNLLIKDFNRIGQTHIFAPDKSMLVDVWTSWIDNEKYYLINSINGYFHKDMLLPFKKGRLENHLFSIPNNTIPLLQYDYGMWNVDREKAAWKAEDRRLVFHWLPEKATK